MDDVQSRLATCFQALFPGLDQPDILHLEQAAYPPWDSVASVTLIQLVEETFGLEIDLFDLEALNSFSALEAYIRAKLAG